MLNSANSLQRWLAMFCLTIAAGMVIWGRTLLLHHLTGLLFLLYWGACLVFSGSAVALGVAEISSLERQRRREREQLIRQTFDRIRRGNDP